MNTPISTNSKAVFFINRSHINSGRIDPYFFHPSFEIIKEKLRSVKCAPLKEVASKIFSGTTPKSGGNAYTDEVNGVPFIRSGDFTEDNEIDFNDLNHILPDVHRTSMRGSQLKKGDLLIAIVGATIGKVGVFDYDRDANINQAICAVRFKSEIKPHFVHIYLLTSLGQKIIDRLKRPVARANINLEEIGTIPIPIINKKKQEEIISYYYQKIKEKNLKELESIQILSRIDPFLFEEIGIPLIKKNKSLKERVFQVTLSKLENRMDPLYYNSDLGIFQTGRFKCVKMDTILLEARSGTGVGRQDQSDVEDGIIQIRPTNIKENGHLNFDKNIYIPEDSLSSSELLKYNDVLFNNTNSQELVGKTAILKSKEKLSFSNHVTRLRVREELIDPDYLCIILNAFQRQKIFYSICTNWNNQSGVGYELLRSLMIPLPPLSTQKEISGKVKKLQKEFNLLRAEGKELMDKAKLHIEDEILSS
jgi:restriction endonuclease S subunit